MTEISVEDPRKDILAVDEALNALETEDQLAAEVVKLRYFAGIGHDQIAEALGITVYQARQKWTYARAWLRDQLDPPRIVHRIVPQNLFFGGSPPDVALTLDRHPQRACGRISALKC